MKKISKSLRPVLVSLLLLTLLCGVLYTGAVTGFANLFFAKQANGSIITVTLKDGTRTEIGSALIAQKFSKAIYLIGRPTGDTNLSPVSDAYKKIVEERVNWWHAFDPSNPDMLPAELIETSGSGVDPYISTTAAEYQITRIAEARLISEESVRLIIKKYTVGRFLGIWGEPAVNVLKVNLALDGLL